MRFKGFRERYSNLYCISAQLQNENIVKTSTDFVIDTGSTLTIISLNDAMRLKLLSINEETFELVNNFNLEIEKTQTSMGFMELLKLNDVIISFYFDDRCYFAEYIEAIYIAKPVIKNKEDFKIMMDIPSILGIDILKNYTIKFSDNIVFLKR